MVRPDLGPSSSTLSINVHCLADSGCGKSEGESTKAQEVSISSENISQNEYCRSMTVEQRPLRFNSISVVIAQLGIPAHAFGALHGLVVDAGVFGGQLGRQAAG